MNKLEQYLINEFAKLKREERFVDYLKIGNKKNSKMFFIKENCIFAKKEEVVKFYALLKNIPETEALRILLKEFLEDARKQ